MVALSMAVSASGAVRSLKTTALVLVDEAVEAIRKAGTVGYQPPAASPSPSPIPGTGAKNEPRSRYSD